jgi:hypothetical protein
MLSSIGGTIAARETVAYPLCGHDLAQEIGTRAPPAKVIGFGPANLNRRDLLDMAL